MSENIPDEIRDECADKARELWSSLRDTAFHNGRNRIAAMLRADLSTMREALAEAEKALEECECIYPCENRALDAGKCIRCRALAKLRSVMEG